MNALRTKTPLDPGETRRSLSRLQRWTTAITLSLFATTATFPAFAQRRRPPARPTQPATPPPPAAPVPDAQTLEARREYEQGRQAVTANNNEEALQHFLRAFELRQNPVVLVPISLAHEALGHVTEAIAAIERYLSEAPANASDRATMQTRLEALRARPATIHVESTPPGARVSLDGTATEHNTPADLTAPGGHHSVRLELEGHTPGTQEFDAAPGVRSAVTVTLEALPPPPPPPAPPPPPPPPPRGTSPAVWVAGGLALAGVGAGTAFGFLALGELSTYNTPGMATRAGRDRGQNYALISDISFGVAVLSAGIGLVVFFTDRAARAREERQRTNTAVRLLPNGLLLTF